MVFSERACSGAKRNNEVLTTLHILARIFSLFHFSSKKKIIILFEKIYIVLIPDKGNR